MLLSAEVVPIRANSCLFVLSAEPLCRPLGQFLAPSGLGTTLSLGAAADLPSCVFTQPVEEKALRHAEYDILDQSLCACDGLFLLPVEEKAFSGLPQAPQKRPRASKAPNSS